MKTYQDILVSKSYIDGDFSDGVGKSAVLSKYDKRSLCEVEKMGAEQVEKAVVSSIAAFKLWSNSSADERYQLLGRIIEKFQTRQEEFSQLIALEAGKPIGYARAEVARCLSTLRFAREEARRIGGEVIPMDFAGGLGKKAFTHRFPLGPVVAISPFNFPLNLALHKIAPAIAAGCSIVIKPSPLAPLALLAFGKVLELAECPRGLVNILCCDDTLAEKLVTDPRFKLLSFTGSPKVGWHLKNIAGKKKILLELGGNAAVIVDESCDLKATAASVAVGACLYAGQICISTQRIYVEESVASEFQKLLIIEFEKLNVGDPLDEETTVGPVISREHLKRIDTWVKDAVEAGATLLTGGKVIDEERDLYAPTLLTNTKTNMKVCCEEVFGPVAILESYQDFEDVLREVNDSDFGLQAGVFTNRIDRMKTAFNSLEVGGLMINNVPGFRVDQMPYGGIKDSGLGREGLRYAIEEMTEPRLLVF